MQSSGGYVERFDYNVEIRPRRNQVTARVGDQVIARTTRALLVDEQDHGLVFYFPEADVELAKLEAIDHVTTCPYKGQASHWALAGGTEPVAWTYREPHPEVSRLLGHVAFYQDRVVVEVGVANPAVVGYER
jgi:uncharacterized protein (DUF427 family)